MNGIITQGENIADNGGVKESYFAYKKWIEVNGAELRLPGLGYSPAQLFWISFAQTWCSNDRVEILRTVINADTHSPNMFRVIGSLGNMNEFMKDFNCPIDSRMNFVEKCEVW